MIILNKRFIYMYICIVYLCISTIYLLNSLKYCIIIISNHSQQKCNLYFIQCCVHAICCKFFCLGKKRKSTKILFYFMFYHHHIITIFHLLRFASFYVVVTFFTMISMFKDKRFVD